MRRLLLLLACFLPVVALAGTPYQATLDEMAEGADHILIGRVTGVDMVDGHGNPVTDVATRTGPGLDNTIRLLITVDEVLVTNADHVPDVLPVPLSNHLHYTLGQIRSAHEGDNAVLLVLLKGSEFSGIKPGVFLRPLEDRERALELYRAAHP